MSLQCPSCGSKDIEPDEARGEAVCVRCGTVCEGDSPGPTLPTAPPTEA